ncbi:MAG: ABC transporter ATP-binding protein [Chloroflexia bacterium]
MAPILELKGITKSFPGVLANDHIDLTLEKGEIHALLGENGAGKTTLMNILYGLYTPDEGRIFINGQEVHIHSPNDAIAHGIGMVHQHFMLVPVMTVAENVMLGVESLLWPYTRKGFFRFLAVAGGALSLLLVLSLLLAGSAEAAGGLLRSLLGAVVSALAGPAAAESLSSALASALNGTPVLGVVLLTLALVLLILLFLAALYGLLLFLTWTRKKGLKYFFLADIGIRTVLLALPTANWPAFRQATLGSENPPIATYVVAAILIHLFGAALSYGLVDTLSSFLNRRQVETRIREISAQYNLQVDPTAYVKDLPVGVQQRVEIIKVLYRYADILILDEPTAVLTPQEVEELFRIMRSLVEQGKSIIFITHKLKEVLAVADRITVLRAGRVVGTTRPDRATEASLAAMMVGREVILTVPKGPARPTEPVLKIQDLHVLDDRGNMAVNGVSCEVYAGEILGVAGVQGNGQTELVEALTGLRPVEAGHVFILGEETTHATPRQIIELGVAHIPEDRQHDGLVLSFPVADNLVLCTYYRPPFARWLTLREDSISRAAADLVARFDVRTPSIFVPASNLSGGNQQKVIVARELSRPIRLLIAAQPTRGLDVGSIEYIHQQLVRKRDEGCAVFLVSTELDEILSLADRIAVMYKGRFMAILPAAEATKERLGLLMAGVYPEEGVAAAAPVTVAGRVG